MGRRLQEGRELALRTVEELQVLVVHVLLVDKAVVGIGRQPGQLIACTNLEATVLCLAAVLQLVDLRVAGVNPRDLLDDVIDEVVESTGLPGEVVPPALVGEVEVDGILRAQVRIGDSLAEFVGISVLHTGEER